MSERGNPLIHRIWVGGSEPEWLRPYAATWLTHHPDRTLVKWTDDTVPQLFPLHNQDIYDHAPELAPNHVGQLRADVLRYEILYRMGGWYVDADFRCLRPLAPMVEGLECFATFEKQDVWVANGLMGAKPGNPFIWRLIEGLRDSVRGNPGARPARTSGPRYLTKHWREHPRALTVLPERLFYPYSHKDVAKHPVDEDFPDCIAVHVWHNQRRERGLL